MTQPFTLTENEVVTLKDLFGENINTLEVHIQVEEGSAGNCLYGLGVPLHFIKPNNSASIPVRRLSDLKLGAQNADADVIITLWQN